MDIMRNFCNTLFEGSVCGGFDACINRGGALMLATTISKLPPNLLTPNPAPVLQNYEPSTENRSPLHIFILYLVDL